MSGDLGVEIVIQPVEETDSSVALDVFLSHKTRGVFHLKKK